ncbi:MAG TPA: TonB family protein [Terracidiphilus sp.]|nr:TonB family protein [Terracidiphilus sp.]
MSTTFLDAVSVGRVIDGKFPLLQELGGTERTSAWLTELDDSRGQKAAIKIFPFKSVDTTATIARWDIATILFHPHLMPLFDAGRCEIDGEDLFYVVTEYADEILSQVLPERPLSAEETREMLGPVLDALSYLHKLCLTHGHLRPTNIMIVEEQLKLSPDFGWCSRIHNIYDPPEAASGNLTPAADIWSLGILLVEALTQRPPRWHKLQGGEPEIPAEIPEPFFSICRDCLRTNPERRCTLAEIKARLNPYQSPESVVQPADAAVDQVNHTDEPFYQFRAMILTGSALVLLFLMGAFKFGWDVTPASLKSLPQLPVAATAAPVPPALHASAPSPQSPAAGIIKASVARQFLPAIPADALHTIPAQITVAIRVQVDPQGKVSHASVESPGPSRYFASQALHAAQNWKFTPAKFGGRAGVSTWLLYFQFGQSQITATQSEESP